jgi:hypothetical protein
MELTMGSDSELLSRGISTVMVENRKTSKQWGKMREAFLHVSECKEEIVAKPRGMGFRTPQLNKS